MAIYHWSLRSFSREQGHSAVAAAAYRAGANLLDARTGKLHAYDRRKGVLSTFILAPATAPSRYADRSLLWNAAEEAETRKNSRVAREVILALPYELTDGQRQALAQDMAAYLVETYRVAVDVAIHRPLGEDDRNHHAHLLFTTRELNADGFGPKTRILDDKTAGPQQVEKLRQVWETLANAALEAAGIDTAIDRRSLEDQGIDRVPETHVGKAAKHAEEVIPAYTEQDIIWDDEKDEDEDSDTDQAGSGTTGGGAQGSGGSVTPKAAATSKDTTTRIIDRQTIDQGCNRLDFNLEIKSLNQQRVAFSPIPLTIQIEKMDRLFDTVDSRLKRLKTLSDKTSMPQRLQKAIGLLFVKAKVAVVNREQAKVIRTLSQNEKQARRERQVMRYGKAYRTGIQEQMREMQQNIAVLKKKQVEYKKYHSFVRMLEIKVEQYKAAKGFLPPLPLKEEWQQKVAIGESVSAKIFKEAQGLKNQLPIEYKDKQAKGSLTARFRETTAVELPDANPANAPLIQAEITNEVEKPSVSESATEANSRMEDWFMPATEKMQSLQEQIARELPNKMQQAQTLPPNEDASLLQRMFSTVVFQNELLEKQTTDEYVHKKIKEEAETARQKILPEFRAGAYSEDTPKSIRMSGGFNHVATTNPDELLQNRKPDHGPELK